MPIAVLDDAEIESTESFSVVLHNPMNSAQLGADHTLTVSVHDDDGSDLAAFNAKHYPNRPSDENIQSEDSDGDGANALLEWLSDTYPHLASSARRPFAGIWQSPEPENSTEYMTLSFYFAGPKPGYKAIIESTITLHLDSWQAIWDSTNDPEIKDVCILTPPTNGVGWMTVRMTNELENKGFMRLRYDPIP